MNASLIAAKESVPSTPALVFDLPQVERNHSRLVEYARQHSMKVRPHTKTHKSLRLGRLQMELGSNGLTAAKVGEAEVMAQASPDVLVAYPTLDPVRTRRLAELAKIMTVRVASDSIEGLEALAAAARAAGTTIGVLIDQDIGHHRTGVATSAIALELAQHAAKLAPALRLDGLFFYPGHVISPASEQTETLTAINAILSETLDMWKKSGLSASIVSGGSTPTAYKSHLIPVQTEIRPGTHLFNDGNTVRGGYCSIEEVAAAVVCTVVSTAVAGKCVLDAGSKTFTSDRNAWAPDSGHGILLEYPEAKVVRLSEEHGEVDLSKCEKRPKLGERVTVVPNHICPCVNLHQQGWLRLADGQLEALPIDAKSMLV